jgi:hypothetical protein
VHIDERPCTSPRRISRVNHSAVPSVGPVAVPDSAPDSIADADLPWATTDDDLSIPGFLDRRAEIDLNDPATVAVQRRRLDHLANRLAGFEPVRVAAE